MKTLEAILTRRSYRGVFLDEPIPREDLRKILEAGLAAPSGCNMQTTSLIAVDDASVLAQLFSVIDPPVIHKCPAMICVLSKPVIAYRNRCYATQDYAAAIESMLLAIVELGYQSCWIEGHITDDDRICDKMARILGVPEEYELVCCLPIGKATQEVSGPKKQPFEARAFFNRFGANA